MKKNLLLISFVFLTTLLCAQITTSEETKDPIQWSQEVWINKDGTSTITFNAIIEEGWHLYSQNLDTAKIGPIPTSFTFTESEDYTLIGNVMEGVPVVEFDTNFEMEIAMFENTAAFSQQIKLKGESGTIEGNISFMVCNDEQCIFPPEYAFTINALPIPMPQEKK